MAQCPQYSPLTLGRHTTAAWTRRSSFSARQPTSGRSAARNSHRRRKYSLRFSTSLSKRSSFGGLSEFDARFCGKTNLESGKAGKQHSAALARESRSRHRNVLNAQGTLGYLRNGNSLAGRHHACAVRDRDPWTVDRAAVLITAAWHRRLYTGFGGTAQNAVATGASEVCF